MKTVFVDTEFTGEHAFTTLVSAGFVTMEGDEFYFTLNDFDRDQVTDWLSENVLNMIDAAASITSLEAVKKLAAWLENYSQGELVRFVSAGLGPDLILTYELWKHLFPERKYFHSLHCLPEYLNHNRNLDLNTLFNVCGLNPAMSRSGFVGDTNTHLRHNSLYDAHIVRRCFLKLLAEYPQLAHLKT